MHRWMVWLGRWSSGAFCSVMVSVFFAASTAQAVPIDLTDATPAVSGVTTLHIEGIATLGSSYWADFEWNANSNVFQVVAYGEEEEPPEGFVAIEPGSFIMGSPTDELGHGGDEVQHAVTLSQGFYLAEAEVTQAQWVAVMGSNPSFYKAPTYPQCDDCPVENVTWYDAVDYCNALSDLEGLDRAYVVNGPGVNWDQSANGYRLPTESEWEYACRAGTTTAFYNGGITAVGCALDPVLDQIGWYCGNSASRTHEVRQKQSNAWGLYDVSGNVYEWCWDWYGNYPGTVTDPVGPVSGAERIKRGGNWQAIVRGCRSAYRSDSAPGARSRVDGLRAARTRP